MSWGYWLIPLTAAVSFVMCGFEAMGLELENPFGCVGRQRQRETRIGCF